MTEEPQGGTPSESTPPDSGGAGGAPSGGDTAATPSGTDPTPASGEAASATTAMAPSGGAPTSTGNAAIAAIDRFVGHIFDAGEAGLTDGIKTIDALQSHVSNALSTVTSKIAGEHAGTAPIVPTAQFAGGLTNEAQKYANEAINELQHLANEVFDLGEDALTEGLKIVDAVQTRISRALSQVTSKVGSVAGKAGL